MKLTILRKRALNLAVGVLFGIVGLPFLPVGLLLMLVRVPHAGYFLYPMTVFLYAASSAIFAPDSDFIAPADR